MAAYLRGRWQPEVMYMQPCAIIEKLVKIYLDELIDYCAYLRLSIRVMIVETSLAGTTSV